MIPRLVLGWVVVSLGLAALSLVWAGLIGIARKVQAHLDPPPPADLDSEQREMLAELERLYRLPAARGRRVR